LSRALLSPWLSIRVQFVLAAVFVVAAISKIADPPGFAHQLHNYQLLPANALNAFALVIPWLELLTGLALFAGLWRRTAAGIIAALLLVFIGALGINLARRHPIDCSCFSTASTQRSDEERLTEMKIAILRDVGLLALCAQVIASGRVPGVTAIRGKLR
jgi:putative oxidoreductase